MIDVAVASPTLVIDLLCVPLHMIACKHVHVNERTCMGVTAHVSKAALQFPSA